jgi:hypothetical protein
MYSILIVPRGPTPGACLSRGLGQHADLSSTRRRGRSTWFVFFPADKGRHRLSDLAHATSSLGTGYGQQAVGQHLANVQEATSTVSSIRFEEDRHARHQSDTERREQLAKLIAHLDTAMLVTKMSDGRLRSRPLAVAAHEGTAELIFSTAIDSPKVGELEHDPYVNVVMQKECFQ